MIRTKAKSLFLGIMLVFASLCLFACKEKPTVGVESITFAEQSISLLVGDEYSPDIKVLPSYATNKSYTLISNDITALKVDGGTITAIKSALGVKLKVVSNDNNNLNDVISINIYDEAVELQTPTALSFDGNKLTFAGKDNANAYTLNVNGQEINIGNNTEYSFDSIMSKLGDLYNQVVECKVRSVGDGKVFNDSEYSESISFVKLSHVKDARIENNVLLFEGIESVATYTVEIFSQGVLDASKTRVINGTSLNLDYLVDSINGSEYTIRITPNTSDYAVDDVTVFSGEGIDVDFAVVGQVKNISINNRVLSWDFVKNAETYVIDLFKGDELLQSYEDVAENNLTLDFVGAGEYRCEILANSTKPNTTTGSEIAQISFKILATPTFVIENNRVAWSKIEDAEGYLVTITNSQNQVLINKGFVFDSEQSLVTYDVSALDADVYMIKVIACGNEQTILSSAETEATEFIKLGAVKNLRVVNKTLVWQNNGVNPVCKYKVAIADGTGNYEIDLAKDDGKVQYDTTSASFMYSLDDYTFIAKEDVTTYYDISVQAMGEGNAFDADVSETKVAKLADASIKELSGGWFTINKAADAVRHNIKISKVGDSGFTSIVLNSTSSGDRFQLVETVLVDAGEYIAQVFAYGNNANILDAENNDGGKKLIKLTAPTLTTDSGKKLQVSEPIENAQEYKIYMTRPNGSTTNFDLLDGYDLAQNATMVGNYVFTAKSIGNGAYVEIDEISHEKAYILNSSIGTQELKVKRLASPTIIFDKNNITATINCSDTNNNGVNYVESYTFTITKKVGTSASIKEVTVPTDSNVVDCSEYINEAGTYALEAKANPKSSVEGYALVLVSATSIVQDVTRLSGVCDFTVSNGNINIKANSLSLSNGEQYKLKLTIDKGTANEIVLDNISNQGAQFIIYAYNANNYSVVNNALAELFTSGGVHTLHTEISCVNKDNIIASEVEDCGTLNVLGKVTTINKNGQTVEFNSVANATNYYALITLNGNEKIINLSGNYTAIENGRISVEIEKLKTLMGANFYLEQAEYSIKFVATSDDIKTFANRGEFEYKFKFLTTPTLSIVRSENGFDKNLTIVGDNITTTYNVVIKQGNTMVGEYNNTTTTTFNLDDVNLVAGNVTVEATAIVVSGDYFNSETKTLNATKLATPELSVSNGLVKWNVVANAEQYNLTYSNSQTTETIVLKRGVENFTMDFTTCTYNFDTLSAGINSLSLQVDAIVGNYLNSDSGDAKEVYKLTTSTIEVVSGRICIKLQKLDIPHTSSVEVKVDNALVDAGLYIENGELKTNNSDVVINTTETLYVVTINPETLLKYGTTEMDDENITVKLFATSDGKSLNSSTASKTVYGLLSPVGLDIVTSYTKPEGSTYITEVLEKIQWQNPTANGEYVAEYEVVVNYNNVKYVFVVNQPIFMMPTYYMEDANGNGKLDCDEDINGNEQLDEDEDINGNGILDSVEVVFGAGTYSITVRSLTDNNDNIVNSKYCEQINVIVLETPDGLKTEDGDVVWSANTNVEYYLIRVYLLKDVEGNIGQTLVMQTQTANNNNKYDLSNIALDVGVYGISVQAMHNHPRTLSSDESDMLQVIRLPQVESYYVKNGELYINIHPFYTKAQITLTNKTTNEIRTFTIENALTIYNDFIANSFTDWVNSNVLETYPLAVPVKYISSGDSTLRALNAMDGYDIKVKLYGNSADNGAIISGAESNNPLNSNLVDENTIKKLITPMLSVSEDERGVVLLGLTENITVPVEYYKHVTSGQTVSLKGVHLYQINLSINDETKVMYVADIVDEDLFEASGCTIIEDNGDDNKLKHFVYDGKMFNVLNKTDKQKIKFNFNTNKYYYYAIDDLVDYQYSNIDLSQGGSFVISARFLGDDTLYLNSNVSAQIKIDRYKSISAGITKGEVYWENQAGELDHPVYIMEIIKGSDNDKEEYKLVLYNEGVETHNIDKLKEQFGDEYFFDVIKYDIDNSYANENIVYSNLSNKLYEMRKQKGIADNLNIGGAFTISIRAHYTSSSPNNTILSQQASSLSSEILPQTDIKLVDGVLTWELSSIKTTSGTGTEYIYDYQLQIDDGNSTHKVILSYDTSKETGDYALKGTTATYELTSPTMITGFTFNAGGIYTFDLTAVSLQAVNSTQVNSITTNIENVKILEDVDIYVDNGLVKWDSGQSVEINIGYMYNDAYVSFTKMPSGQQYNLPNSETIDGTYTVLASGVQYKIKARLKGNNVSNINGFYSGTQTMQRLTTIKADTIKTVDGVLVWEDSSYGVFDTFGNFVENSSEGISYTIVYSYVEDGIPQTKTVSNIMNKSFDFAGVPAGEIKVKIYANHNFNFTSFASDEVTLYKLQTPLEKYSVDTENNTISWNKVVDNMGNSITTYQVVVMEGENVSAPMDSDNVWEVEGVSSAEFKIIIRAVIKGESNLINSDYTEGFDVGIPNSVDTETFVFDNQLQQFKWMAIEGEQEGDTYYIGYQITTSGGVNVYEDEIKSPKDSDGCYYFKPYIIGIYNQIYIKVVRAESLPSQLAYYKGDSASVQEFNLFESGDGKTEDTAYVITSETHLRNIKYFPDAIYQIPQDGANKRTITLTSTEPILDKNSIFTGEIYGNGAIIQGLTIDKSGLVDTYMGLFHKVENAIIDNIQLQGFDIVVNNPNTNKYEMYIGILVAQASNTEFTNIVIIDSAVTIFKETSDTNDTLKNIYFGSIVGHATSCTFDSCEVKLRNNEQSDSNVTIDAVGSQNSVIAIGGFVGYADTCTLKNVVQKDGNYTFISCEEPKTDSKPAIYYGALVGQGKNLTIENTTYSYGVKHISVGGVSVLSQSINVGNIVQ